jgi:hypothetical protein
MRPTLTTSVENRLTSVEGRLEVGIGQVLHGISDIKKRLPQDEPS